MDAVLYLNGMIQGNKCQCLCYEFSMTDNVMKCNYNVYECNVLPVIWCSDKIPFQRTVDDVTELCLIDYNK